jgi:hypothetical protein
METCPVYISERQRGNSDFRVAAAMCHVRVLPTRAAAENVESRFRVQSRVPHISMVSISKSMAKRFGILKFLVK